MPLRWTDKVTVFRNCRQSLGAGPSLAQIMEQEETQVCFQVLPQNGKGPWRSKMILGCLVLIMKNWGWEKPHRGKVQWVEHGNSVVLGAVIEWTKAKFGCEKEKVHRGRDPFAGKISFWSLIWAPFQVRGSSFHRSDMTQAVGVGSEGEGCAALPFQCKQEDRHMPTTNKQESRGRRSSITRYSWDNSYVSY